MYYYSLLLSQSMCNSYFYYYAIFHRNYRMNKDKVQSDLHWDNKKGCSSIFQYCCPVLSNNTGHITTLLNNNEKSAESQIHCQ